MDDKTLKELDKLRDEFNEFFMDSTGGKVPIPFYS